jgi:hypothetical protein
MFQAPAICQVCKTIFPSTVGIAPGASGLALIGNVQTCPQCGSDAPIVDGVYSFVDHTVRVLANSALSVQQLTELFQLLQDATENEHPIQDTHRKAVEIAPVLAKLFDVAGWSDIAKATLLGQPAYWNDAGTLRDARRLRSRHSQQHNLSRTGRVVLSSVGASVARHSCAPAPPDRRRRGRMLRRTRHGCEVTRWPECPAAARPQGRSLREHARSGSGERGWTT